MGQHRKAIGVLALQGAFSAHSRVLTGLGARAVEVRMPDDLTEIDAIVMPGGESTTMSMLLDSTELREPLGKLLADGMPVFGTCAGMILLATSVLDGRADQRSFAIVDIAVRRNGYGRQVDSFESDLVVAGLDGGPFHAVFIRAPLVTAVGPSATVLATHDDAPVLVTQGSAMVAAFHPELSDDARLHHRFLQGV